MATYTGSWANLGAGILGSLANATSAPTSSFANYGNLISSGATNYNFTGGIGDFSGVDWTSGLGGNYSSLTDGLNISFTQ